MITTATATIKPNRTRMSLVSQLTQVEVDEMLGLVGHEAAKVAADDAVPGRVVLLVELLLDVGGNILRVVVVVQQLR